MPPVKKTGRPEGGILQAAIIGAGPAGIGVSLALRAMGLRHLAVLDQGRIGESFLRWPQGMRFITPSFTGNQYGSLDLNSVHPSTSPAYLLKTEHPTGEEYAAYLETVAAWGSLPVLTGYGLKALTVEDGIFHLDTGKGVLKARNVVWAAGEFHWPKKPAFPGAELGMHNSTVKDWSALPGKRAVVIGGYESGIDAAYHLTRTGKQVTLLDASAPWDIDDSDPSVNLSPYSLDRLRVAQASGRLAMYKADATAIVGKGKGFAVKANHKAYASDCPPILATGFRSSLQLIAERFAFKQGEAQVRLQDDQSTKTPGLYLAGPSLRHRLGRKKLVFCFIYKYRGRFPIVAASIGKRLGLAPARIAEMTRFYREHKMYLEDLSCCGDDCAC
jgi:thioredoxin reductase